MISVCELHVHISCWKLCKTWDMWLLLSNAANRFCTIVSRFNCLPIYDIIWFIISHDSSHLQYDVTLKLHEISWNFHHHHLIKLHNNLVQVLCIYMWDCEGLKPHKVTVIGPAILTPWEIYIRFNLWNCTWINLLWIGSTIGKYFKFMAYLTLSCSMFGMLKILEAFQFHCHIFMECEDKVYNGEMPVKWEK